MQQDLIDQDANEAKNALKQKLQLMLSAPGNDNRKQELVSWYIYHWQVQFGADSQIDFSGIQFKNIHFTEFLLNNANFESARFENCVFSFSSIRDCSFKNATIADGSELTFLHSTVNEVNFSGVDTSKVKLVSTNIDFITFGVDDKSEFPNRKVGKQVIGICIDLNNPDFEANVDFARIIGHLESEGENVTKRIINPHLFANGNVPDHCKRELINTFLDNVSAVAILGSTYSYPLEYFSDGSKSSQSIDDLAKVDMERLKFEEMLAQEAILRRIPIIGTCNGMHIINHVMGGSLKTVDGHKNSIQTPSITMVFEGESHYKQETSTDKLEVNCCHERSIDQVAEGLKVIGRDKDGNIELMMDDKEEFIIASQYHPETLVYMDYLRCESNKYEPGEYKSHYQLFQQFFNMAKAFDQKQGYELKKPTNIMQVLTEFTSSMPTTELVGASGANVVKRRQSGLAALDVM